MADPVPQILDGVQHVPRERVQNLVGKQIVDVPVPHILEQSVEVIKVILQEQCQLMRLFSLERQLLTGVFGGLRRVVVRLQKHRRQHGWTCPQPSPSLCSQS